MRILITGASGFVGRALVPHLVGLGHEIHAVHRGANTIPSAAVSVTVNDIGPDTDWSDAFNAVDTVVHLAARVHQVRDLAPDPSSAYRRVNTEGTRRLAEAAACAGVRRFVFLSSIKALAEASGPRPLDDSTPPAPVTPYGVSKLEAERALFDVARNSGMEAVVLRPPLIYGPGVGANFQRLLRLCSLGWPLPFGAIRNRRSLIYLGNLIDALARCVEHPAAAGHRFLVHDGTPISTPALIQELASAMGRPARLISVPPTLLRTTTALLGRSDAFERLAGSLDLDDRVIREILAWSPSFHQRDGLRMTAEWYMSFEHSRPG